MTRGKGIYLYVYPSVYHASTSAGRNITPMPPSLLGPELWISEEVVRGLEPVINLRKRSVMHAFRAKAQFL